MAKPPTTPLVGGFFAGKGDLPAECRGVERAGAKRWQPVNAREPQGNDRQVRESPKETTSERARAPRKQLANARERKETIGECIRCRGRVGEGWSSAAAFRPRRARMLGVLVKIWELLGLNRVAVGIGPLASNGDLAFCWKHGRRVVAARPRRMVRTLITRIF